MHQFSKQPSSFSPSNTHSSLFRSRPFSPETAHRSSSAQNRDLKEVFQLQLKEDRGTISQVQRERLTYLQGKITNNLFKKQSRIQKYYSDYEIHFADSPTPAPVQPKLSVGEPNDKYEREADRVASEVVDRIHAPATSNPSLQKEDRENEEIQTKVDRKPKLIYTGNKLNRSLQPLPYFEKPHPSPINFPSTANRAINLAIQRLEEQKDEDIQTKLEISALQKQEQDLEEQKDEDATLQGKSILQRAEVTEDIESSINNARGSGQSLDANLQKTMGQAMGADFSGVKVHTNSTADRLNKSVQARAFTTGQDVFFKQGEYNPGSKDGQELIAHELTHVVQQNGENLVRQKLVGMRKVQDLDKKFINKSQNDSYQQNKIQKAPGDDEGTGVLGFEGKKKPTGYGSVVLKAELNGEDLGDAWSQHTSYTSGAEHAEDAVVDYIEHLQGIASGLVFSDTPEVDKRLAATLNNSKNLKIYGLTASPCCSDEGTSKKDDIDGCAQRLIKLAGDGFSITVEADHYYQPHHVKDAKSKSQKACQAMQAAGITVVITNQ